MYSPFPPQHQCGWLSMHMVIKVTSMLVGQQSEQWAHRCLGPGVNHYEVSPELSTMFKIVDKCVESWPPLKRQSRSGCMKELSPLFHESQEDVSVIQGNKRWWIQPHHSVTLDWSKYCYSHMVSSCFQDLCKRPLQARQEWVLFGNSNSVYSILLSTCKSYVIDLAIIDKIGQPSTEVSWSY